MLESTSSRSDDLERRQRFFAGTEGSATMPLMASPDVDGPGKEMRRSTTVCNLASKLEATGLSSVRFLVVLFLPVDLPLPLAAPSV